MLRKSLDNIIKIITIIFIIIIILIIIIPKILNIFFSKDEPAPNENDFILENILISEKENSYYDLIKLKDVIYTPEKVDINDYPNSYKWDDVIVKEIIEKNNKAFIYLNNAFEKKYFQDPSFSDLKNISYNTAVLAPLNPWREIVKLNYIKSLYLQKIGKDNDALKEAFNVIKLGDKIENSRCELVECLVGNAIKKTGFELLINLISKIKLSPFYLKSYIKELNSFSNNREGHINSLKIEYLLRANVVNNLKELSFNYKYDADESYIKYLLLNLSIPKRVKNNYYFKPNKTKKILIEQYKTEIEKILLPCKNIYLENENKFIRNIYLALLTENAIGKIIIDSGSLSYNSIHNKICNIELLGSIAKTILAIKAYELNTGYIPENLNELIPKYLDSIPIDPYSGNIIKYMPNRKLIYSLGFDRIDNGGSEGKDWETMPDPTFNVDF